MIDIVKTLKRLVGEQDTEWQYPILTSQFTSYYDDVAPRYRKSNNVVQLTGIIKPTSDIAGGTTEYTIFTLPPGYRPGSIRYVAQVCQGSGTCVWLLRAYHDGAVSFARYRDGNTYTTAATSAWLTFNVCFFTD